MEIHKMEKQLIAGALLVAGAMASIGAVAGYVAVSRPLYAEVVTVEPVTRLVTVQRQDCPDSHASRGKKGQRRLTGTVIGGMVGGVIGRQSGDGSGPNVATMAAAAGDANAGDRVRKTMQETSPEGRCRIVNRTEQQAYAYDVRYRFDGKLGTVRMGHQPGARIPVRDGKLDLLAAEAKI
jgi:uncharacterized protein YcfJ